MTNVATTIATSGAAGAAVIAEAIKASGVIVRVRPDDFMAVLQRAEAPLVVVATGGLFRKHYQYLTGYKGLAFFTKSDTPLALSGQIELVAAEKIWIPG